MQREILFRGKRLDNGEWAYGYLEKRPSAIQGPDYSGPWYIWTPPADPDDSGGYYNVDPETVGQYTGLEDWAGEKIFEGDIVTSLIYGDRRITEWDVKTASFIISTDDGKDQDDFCLCQGVEFNVIGNRWDNQELLEAEK